MANMLIVSLLTGRVKSRRLCGGFSGLLDGAIRARFDDASSALPHAAEAPAPFAAAEGALTYTAMDSPQVVIVNVGVPRAGNEDSAVTLVIFGLLFFEKPSENARAGILSVTEALMMLIVIAR